MKPKIHIFIYSLSKYIAHATCRSWSSYNQVLQRRLYRLKIILFDSVLKKRIVINNRAINSFWSLSDLLNKCTLWPQTTQELLAVLQETFITKIHLISINTLQAICNLKLQTKMFYTPPLSLKILLNLCLLSFKQETACKILKSE